MTGRAGCGKSARPDLWEPGGVTPRATRQPKALPHSRAETKVAEPKALPHSKAALARILDIEP